MGLMAGGKQSIRLIDCRLISVDQTPVCQRIQAVPATPGAGQCFSVDVELRRLTGALNVSSTVVHGQSVAAIVPWSQRIFRDTETGLAVVQIPALAKC